MGENYCELYGNPFFLIRTYGRPTVTTRTAKQVKDDYNRHLQKHCLSKTRANFSRR